LPKSIHAISRETEHKERNSSKEIQITEKKPPKKTPPQKTKAKKKKKKQNQNKATKRKKRKRPKVEGLQFFLTKKAGPTERKTGKRWETMEDLSKLRCEAGERVAEQRLMEGENKESQK